MKWSDNDDNWRDYAEAHPAQAERIRAISRRDRERGRETHPPQAAETEPGTDTPYGRTHPDYPGWYEDDIP
ncbi:MAG: hypothetical protein A2792_01130 [Sphingomonadales bacterium RIFCSPHIGHO2_01_FULL_65_20]|nr:MAG: hypothetical protein A2792_01130 [Sphingomonadales bacterium RIFCSPHIGHO2_01_FULL_65_20]